MASVLLLAAAGAAGAALLALRLWVVLRSRAPGPRQSLSLLVVAGSGEARPYRLSSGDSKADYCYYLSQSGDQVLKPCERYKDITANDMEVVEKLSENNENRKQNKTGGHTTEILRLLEKLSNAYSPRHYIIADTDEMSAHKINSFELDRADRDPNTMFPEYYIHRIPRSREVRQSWLSTVVTTLYSMWLSFPLTHRVKPDLAHTRGPGNLLPQQRMPGLWPSSALSAALGRKKDYN
ncbi:UDP-N-acetylglucosamine transferase subunit ALG14 isoform X2 [Canis lupus baileyi]|uniref:UDP-N-acetylglucosamine transferase subunit ALG14 homolog isoform X2 n=1 Tax=Canis lupus familiaris TaxID=9615 RepID=UPI0015F17921|nr:UDP-N-acetylglucosamine transferase subunit ALG14 homolog isoform X2 [Canis lupus familiaris]XP_038410460.1 UDP-N-acetylglucosamine transferase subunit ALG14 homolog isoform X2 [Canis lupus familiaris]XP_038525977.1 UDP-N-acetylglucosamine transferase subunit ALG14 homolog isoform X2 [Canis lupus familiaris]